MAIHLYVPGEAVLGGLRLRVETRMPDDGRVRLTVLGEAPVDAELALRIPGWTTDPTLRVAGAAQAVAAGTYHRLCRTWRPGEVIELDLPMPVQRLHAHPKIRQCAGQVALRRGPLIWCLEQADNGTDLADLRLPDDAAIACRPGAGPGGADLLAARGTRSAPDAGGLYRTMAPGRKACDLTFVPYAVWGNRGVGEMRVWVRR
jgi:DUF1680 family protein